MEDERFLRYSQRLNRLRDIAKYMYVVHVLENSHTYEEVTDIFVRVNSLGAKLRSSDLALAQISSRWPNVLAALDGFAEECEQWWFTLDTGLLVRAMVVFATHQCKFNIVANTKIDKLKSAWEEAKEGLRFAINFLRSNAGIEDESLLSSPFLYMALAVLNRIRDNKLSSKDTQMIHYWLNAANARGRYSWGSSETLLNEDLAILFRSGDPSQLVDRLKRQFGRLHLESGDFEGRRRGSSLFSMTFLALKDAGATDWSSGLEISLSHQGRLHFVQYHHVFPKSQLKKAGCEPSEINEIANMAFIGGQTNRRLSNKLPSVYFPHVIDKRGKKALLAQAIPDDPKLYELDNYRGFLAARRELLAGLVSEYIKKPLEA